MYHIQPTYAKCNNCDFSIDYRPYHYIYRYPGLHSQPQLSYAWCEDCKKFVPIQKGVNIEKLQRSYNRTHEELNRLEKKIFKFKNTENKIKSTREKLRELALLVDLVDNQSTQTTCLECNGTNLVDKDIENQIWHCPKCNIGQLVLEETDTILFLSKIPDKIVFPQINKINNDESPLVSKVILCANNLIKNERIYYRLSNNIKDINSLSNDLSLLDRICLIYIVITKLMMIHTPSKAMFIIKAMNHPMLKNVVTQDVRDLVMRRLDKMIDFFKTEIELLQKTELFLPNAIIKTLRNNREIPSNNIYGIDPSEAMCHWKVITDTIDAYFRYYQKHPK